MMQGKKRYLRANSHERACTADRYSCDIPFKDRQRKLRRGSGCDICLLQVLLNFHKKQLWTGLWVLIYKPKQQLSAN